MSNTHKHCPDYSQEKINDKEHKIRCEKQELTIITKDLFMAWKRLKKNCPKVRRPKHGYERLFR